MEKVFTIPTDSLFALLFWGNVISTLFLLVARGKSRVAKEKNFVHFFIAARFFHAVYYFVAAGRGLLPDWLSVQVGITMLFFGYYFEARGILRVVKENTKFTDRLLIAILAAAVLAFTLVELWMPAGGLRIVTASLGSAALMALPIVRMLTARDASVYTKPSAVFYLVFVLLLLVRAVYGLQNPDTGILTTNVLQSVTFLASLLQLIVALPSYTLIIKGYADEALVLMATTDRLTGATNRHAFLDAAGAVFRTAKRFHFPLSVLFMDIDYFKRVNDTFGHAFGDAVLSRFATLIDKCLRESDLSCRYGGEEFVVLLPKADAEAARNVAERILQEVRQARFDEHPGFTFSVSIGIASYVPATRQSFEDVIQVADQAMYRAKAEGRDRIVGGG